MLVWLSRAVLGATLTVSGIETPTSATLFKTTAQIWAFGGLQDSQSCFFFFCTHCRRADTEIAGGFALFPTVVISASAVEMIGMYASEFSSI